MKILIISPQVYPCTTGGMEIFNHFLACGLSKAGHEVGILTLCTEHINKCVESFRINKRFLIIPSFSVVASIFYNICVMRKKFDVIHVPYTSNSYLAYPVLFAKKIFNSSLRYVVVIHGGGMHPWKRARIHKAFFESADAIIAVSEPIGAEYERRCKKKISVIPPIIPFKNSKTAPGDLRKKYGFKDKDLIVLCLGSIKAIKGSDLLFEAFAGLGGEYLGQKNLHLVYAGDGPLRMELERKAKSGGFDRFVHFLGNIPYSQIPELYRLSDYYVIPSLFEGNPISLLEAMFNGMPVLGSNTSGINSLIRHNVNGLLFSRGDVNDLQDKLRILVGNGPLCKTLAAAAKKDYERNPRFEDMIAAHTDIYGRIEEGAK